MIESPKKPYLYSSHSFSVSMKIWIAFLSHYLYYVIGLSFAAAFLLFLGYFFNFYGMSDNLLVWGNGIFFATLFGASFFALHQSLGRYVATSSLNEVLQDKTPAPRPDRSPPFRRLFR